MHHRVIFLAASWLCITTGSVNADPREQAASLRMFATYEFGQQQEPLHLGLRWQARHLIGAQNNLSAPMQWDVGLSGLRSARFNGLPLYLAPHLNADGEEVGGGTNYWTWGLAAAGAVVAGVALGGGGGGGSSGSGGGPFCGSDAFHMCDGRVSAVCGSPPNQRLDDDGDCSTTYDTLGTVP